MKGLFMRYLYVKYQNPIPNSSKDMAQVKVFSLRCDADANADADSRPGELKNRDQDFTSKDQELQ
jgi:hypothetical protein